MMSLNGRKTVMVVANAFTHDPRVTSESRSLIKQGWQVTVIALDRSGKNNKQEERDGVKIERIRLRTPTECLAVVPYFLLFNAIVFLKLIVMKFDVVHCHDFDTLLAGSIAAKMKGKPVIYDSHEFYPMMIMHASPWIVVNIVYAVETIVSRKVDWIITAGKNTSITFLRRGIKKVSILMNCKDPSDFAVKEENIQRIRKELGALDKCFILYDGWLDFDCGLPELFQAIEKLAKFPRINNFLIVVVGDGYLGNSLKQIVAEKGIEEYVVFVGKIPLNIIPLYVKASDIMYVLYNSTADPHAPFRNPNRLFEAIIAGKPILASNSGELASIVNDVGCGITVNPRDINEIANALFRLINECGLQKKFAQNSTKASEIYNWSNMAKILIDIYENL